MQSLSDEEKFSDPRELAVILYIEALKYNKTDKDKIMEAVKSNPSSKPGYRISAM